MKFELVFYNVIVLHISHYTMWTFTIQSIGQTDSIGVCPKKKKLLKNNNTKDVNINVQLSQFPNL